MSLLNQGYQYLTESRYDQIDTALEPIRRGVIGARLAAALARSRARAEPVRIHVPAAGRPRRRRHDDFVPCRDQTDRAAQWPARELHVPAGAAQSVCLRLASASIADRAQRRQCLRWATRRMVCRRWPAFPRRPAGARARRDGVHGADREWLSPLSRRIRLAPDRAIWARDNRGVMVRVLGQPGDPSTHLENRIGEPAANPYLYMASQIYAGLDGIAHKRDPGPSADTPYETQAPAAAEGSRRSGCGAARQRGFSLRLRRRLRRLLRPLKEAEFARFNGRSRPGQGGVTAWEQNEYFDLF